MAAKKESKKPSPKKETVKTNNKGSNAQKSASGKNGSASAGKRGSLPQSAVQSMKPEISEKDGLVTVTLKFKVDKNGGHNHVIVDNIDDNHVSVGLTTQKKKGKNSTNFKLEHSPLPNDKTSYARRQATVAPKKSYTTPRAGKVTTKDLTRLKQYGEKAKKKYIAQKKSKKK